MSSFDAFARAVNRKPLSAAQEPKPPVDAVVSKIDSLGVYVTPIGSDLTAISIGPCAGSYRRDFSTCPDAAHSHPLVPIPLGTKVQLIRTPNGEDWITRIDERPS